MLPNFFIVGAPKAGTTSLYDYFRAHPEIYMSPVKGPRFFCYTRQADPWSYRFRTLEDYQALFDGVTAETAVGEATALYFEYPATAGRIAELVPDARIIAVLREPVQRAFSIYHMNLRDRGTYAGQGFLEALEQDGKLRKLYFDGLKPFFERFPCENIKVILFDELATDPLATVQALYGFLGVRTDFVPDLAVSNPGGVPKNRLLHKILVDPRLRAFSQKYVPEPIVAAAKRIRSRNLEKHRMTEAERDGAYRFFHEDLLRTQELIGIDLSRWIRAQDTGARPAEQAPPARRRPPRFRASATGPAQSEAKRPAIPISRPGGSSARVPSCRIRVAIAMPSRRWWITARPSVWTIR